MDTAFLVLVMLTIWASGVLFGYLTHKIRTHRQLGQFYNALAEHIEKIQDLPDGEQVANAVRHWIRP